jgi:hypothetical protein
MTQDSSRTTADTPGHAAVARLAASLGQVARSKGPPPVERWNPPDCGEIDMRIAVDGTWFYNGSPIGRAALVKLFSTVLRKDPERYVLVTPVERLGIVVDDVPFLAVEMALDGEGADRRIAFRTNVDDVVSVDDAHPLRFERDERGGLKPYVLVRGGLWARLTRALTYDLVDLGEEKDAEGGAMFGITVAGHFYPVAPAAEIAGLA